MTHVGLRVLQAVDPPLFLSEVRRKGRSLRSMLGGLSSPLITEVRGRGLFIGVKVNTPPPRVVEAALSKRLLLVAGGDSTVRFLPPLNVADDDLENAVARFGECLQALEKGMVE